VLTYSRLGTRGNLGNQLFQIASVMGLAEKYRHYCFFPKWYYADYFQNQLPTGAMDSTFIHMKEKDFHFHEWNLDSNKNYDLQGWLQSEKYFDTSKTKEIFTFNKGFTDRILEKYKFIFVNKTILVSVRRGDFVNNPNYFQLSYRYYLLALIQNFQDWESRTIVFTSDDISYCKMHYSFLKNAIFLENIPPMEQIVLGIHCDDYVISNSTFSWWIAWLGEDKNKRIIRPVKNLRGQFAKLNDDKDYFPERWIKFDDRQYSLPLKYLPLMVKGVTYQLAVNLKYLYSSNLNKTKKFIKKLIGRK